LSRATAKSPDPSILAVRAKKECVASTLRIIAAQGLLDRSRKVVEMGCYVEIPVTSNVPGFPVVTQESPNYYRRVPDLAEALKDQLLPKEIELLPRGWHILGDVIVVKIHPQLDSHQGQIANALLDYYPRCRTVLRDYGIEGPYREPVRKIIAGTGTETVHRENGVTYCLDAARVMFSAGNLKERMRMGNLGRGESVVDMFAGIGYFALPMAVHSRPRRILAIELNPNAYHYLCLNIKKNRVEELVKPVLGDCAKVTPEGVADRVVMGMVQVTDRYLQKGIGALRPGGVLHYHQTVPTRMYPEQAISDIKEAARALGRRSQILKCIRVKKYSPGVVHCVVDARIE